jgi:F-type H+-transporting ATPase subunit epsilon
MPMKDGIHLEIATAGGSVYDDMVSYVELPFSGGSVGVLKDHAPMLGAIEDGVVTARKEDGTTEFVAVNLGVANIVHNEVTLLVRTAERAENIDLPRAEAAERRARERLADKGGDWDMKRAQIALHRAMARQAAVRMMKGR